MAEKSTRLDARVVNDIRELIWGNNLKDEVFSRWTQGFDFSKNEATALEQHEGGPCAIIASVQAFILKQALFDGNPEKDLSKITSEEAKELLTKSLTEILSTTSTGRYFVLSISNVEDKEDETADENNTEPSTSHDQEEHRTAKRPRLDQELFHSKLRCTECENEESLKTVMQNGADSFTDSFGVLLYLYSLILSKGIEQIKNEVEEVEDPLIDGIHGYGSQSLINLFLCGKAVSNVWDNDKDVSGLKLHGIPNQTTIGFLTLMEHLRYCEVGWYLKNPCYPIWLIGSETHITVLFAKLIKSLKMIEEGPHVVLIVQNRGLVITENSKSKARQVFHSFDPEGNGFIGTDMLGDILGALDLVSEKEYVDIMKTKLDAEDLGIITMNCFMEEFYPEDTSDEMPTDFELYMYNGLASSCPDSKVKYRRGLAKIQEELELQIITDVSPLKLCLQTKWPTIEIKWDNDQIPSIN